MESGQDFIIVLLFTKFEKKNLLKNIYFYTKMTIYL